jgi:hypothetical protein
MLKKTLIAASVAFVASSAFASDSTLLTTGLTNTGASAANPTIGQGAAGKGITSFNPSSVVYTMSSANAYDSAEKVNIALDGGSFGLGTNVSAVLANSGGTSTALTVTYNGTANSFSLGGLSAALLADSSSITLSGMEIVPSSSNVGDSVMLSVAMVSSIGATVIDTITGNLGTFIDQVSTKVTDTFGSKIDVANASKLLVDGSDAIAVEYTYTPADYGSLSGSLSAAASLTGDFAWLYDASSALISGQVAGGGSFDFSSAAIAPASEVTLAASTGIVSTSATVNFTPTLSGGVLPTSAFTGAATVKAGTVVVDTADLEFKSWTLNGSDVTIPYMPFGSAFAQSITLTNSGSVVGDITATFTANGKTYDSVSVGTAAAKSVTNVGSAVNAAATALGLKDAQVQLSVTSPAADIEVVAIYYSKADGDRVQTYSSNTVN